LWFIATLSRGAEVIEAGKKNGFNALYSSSKEKREKKSREYYFG
jgi:hypothetical protein